MHGKISEMRLNKFLANKGFGSRREVDGLIEAGRVNLNDKQAPIGCKLVDGDKVSFKGKDYIYKEEELASQDHIYLILNKPAGVVCTLEKKEKDNLYNYLKKSQRKYIVSDSAPSYEDLLKRKIYPVGRLDKNSRGLILLSNDGDLTQELTHPKFESEKEYLVKCQNKLRKKFLKDFKAGVEIEVDGKQVKTIPCEAKQTDEDEFLAILTQGYKRQIREMCKALGNYVEDLQRIRIAGVALSLYKELREGSSNSDMIFLDGLDEGYFTCLSKDIVDSYLAKK